MRGIGAILLLIFSFHGAIGANGARAADALPERWQSTHYSTHPLVGKIFSGTGVPIDSAALEQVLSKARFVLLGEAHNNPDHHTIQANLIRARAQSRPGTSVVFEMVPRRYAQQIAQVDLAKDPNLDAFAKRLEWEKRGWYSWDIYRPVALAAAENALPMVAGNLDRDLTRSISKSGMDALTTRQRKDYGLETEMPADLETSLLAELKGSHCGMMPEAALPAMVNVQRAKDGSMADALLKTEPNSGAVLIAGTGHIRKDRGVPAVLAAFLSAPTIAIGLLEVAEDARTFADFETSNEQGDALYDYVIFTPKFDITDPCVEMREQFKNSKKKSK